MADKTVRHRAMLRYMSSLVEVIGCSLRGLYQPHEQFRKAGPVAAFWSAAARNRATFAQSIATGCRFQFQDIGCRRSTPWWRAAHSFDGVALRLHPSAVATMVGRRNRAVRIRQR